MRKRLLTSFLAFLLCVSLLPIMKQTAKAAQYSYDASAALNYAKNHWNDDRGECAAFVSRCVREGGIDISVEDGTGPCYRAIGNATGLGPFNKSEDQNNLSCLPDLILGSGGNAKKSANEHILSAGDVVIQWCYTCHKSPHMLLCGGYNSDGNATYYAHNSARDNKIYNLTGWVSTKHQKNSCVVGAKVIHLTGGSGTTPVTPPPVIPPPPADFNAAKVSSTTARLSWNAVSGATSYEVQYYSQAACAWKTDPDYKNSYATSYITTGLGKYDAYDFCVRAVNSAGSSPWTKVTYVKKGTDQIVTPVVSTTPDQGAGTQSDGELSKTVNEAYADVIAAIIQEHGIFEKAYDEEGWISVYPKGFTYGELIDFDHDGIDEMVCAYSPNGWGVLIRIYQFDGTQAQLLIEQEVLGNIFQSDEGAPISFLESAGKQYLIIEVGGEGEYIKILTVSDRQLNVKELLAYPDPNRDWWYDIVEKEMNIWDVLTNYEVDGQIVSRKEFIRQYESYFPGSDRSYNVCRWVWLDTSGDISLEQATEFFEMLQGRPSQ